jgi:micrococcal nuclease
MVLAALAGGLAMLGAADRAGFFGRAARGDWETYEGRTVRVSRVIDGDTVEVDLPDRGSARTRVRLIGVDAPETVHPDRPPGYFGRRASRYLRELLSGREVRLELDRCQLRDRHGRLLAYLALPDGTDVSERLIATGHGYAYPVYRHPRLSRYRQVQKEAMAAGAGLWAGVRETDLPHYYRGRLRLPERATEDP